MSDNEAYDFESHFNIFILTQKEVIVHGIKQNQTLKAAVEFPKFHGGKIIKIRDY